MVLRNSDNKHNRIADRPQYYYYCFKGYITEHFTAVPMLLTNEILSCTKNTTNTIFLKSF